MSYELPSSLRVELDAYALDKVGGAGLRLAAEEVSLRYRREAGRNFQIKNEAEALSYIVARLPATYAANRRVLSEIETLLPDFAPLSVLDVGAGPGTASLAAVESFSSVESLHLVEMNRYLQQAGQDLICSRFPQVDWVNEKVEQFTPRQTYDLILSSYVLNELSLASVLQQIKKLWAMCSGCLVILEPGTPEGGSLISMIRDAMIGEENTHLLGPCPHEVVCPLKDVEGVWCHFSVRTSRTKLHKTLKGGDAGFEDEKFSYLVLSRFAVKPPVYRLIGHPAGAKLRELQVCGPKGAETLQVSKSHPLHKRSKKLDWGDGFDL